MGGPGGVGSMVGTHPSKPNRGEGKGGGVQLTGCAVLESTACKALTASVAASLCARAVQVWYNLLCCCTAQSCPHTTVCYNTELSSQRAGLNRQKLILR